MDTGVPVLINFVEVKIFMELTTKLLLKEKLTFRMESEKGFLMDGIEGDVYEINETTQYILEKCDGIHSLSDILQMLSDINKGDEFKITKEDILEIANFLIVNNICSIV